MKVVVTDYSFESLDVEKSILEPLGCEVVACRRIGATEDLIGLVADADGVLTQFAPLTAPVIEAMTRARVIVRYGVGVDNVDGEAARRRHIPVCNIPDYCTEEVADHTLALMLAVTRRIVPGCVRIQQGSWGLGGSLSDMKGLYSLTVGVVGLGRIGRGVVRRLAGFGCRILAHDPVLSSVPMDAAGAELSSLDNLLSQSDIVTLHCPSTPQTRRLLRRETLERMKPGVIVVNVGRGDLVDSAALVEALESGRVAAAGLDVFDPEPIPPDHPLLRMPQVVVSAHVASVSARAVQQLHQSAAHLVARVLRGEPPANVVNGVPAEAGKAGPIS